MAHLTKTSVTLSHKPLISTAKFDSLKRLPKVFATPMMATRRFAFSIVIPAPTATLAKKMNGM